MAAKKQAPRLRLKLKKKTWFKKYYDLQEWSETQNKYIDVPFVE